MAHAKSTDPNVFILPDLGEGVHEAELIKWRVKVGDTVAEHDILAEMETDKALVEVPSPRAGTIKTLHGTEGEIQHVGNPLVTYEGGGAAGAAEPKPAASKPGKSGSQNGSHAAKPEAETEAREDDGTVVGKMSGAIGGVSAEPGKVLATPAVRRLARDLGVDISCCAGTGIAGRVTEKDVRDAAGGVARHSVPGTKGRGLPDVAPIERSEPRSRVVESPRSVAAPAARAPAEARHGVPGHQEESIRVPFRGVRRTIANRLRESVNQAVHFNVMDEADVSMLDGLRKKLAAASGEKISFLPFVAAAVCRVLTDARFRAMNATVDEKPSDSNYEAAIVQHRAVHLGIAADTENGLMVPVIRDCDALGVLEIGRHIAHVAEAARNRTASREQLMGSTFTISNVGSHAGRFATPIINYPEVGILGVGRARPAPVVRNGGIFVGNLLPLSLACDHRVVDGATAALALAEIIRLLQEPEVLMGPARA
ncbi:MAG: 2-oxo acid dehydrogenase subunit E2 [Phycisphaeraceae bacterium]|nr:2-oxo acid dehydrogenase subunit E2 [Phycisphaeraceae bacterium]